jgi:hypothetical protein
MVQTPAIDVSALRKAIQHEYGEVAAHPDKGFHFHVGRELTLEELPSYPAVPRSERIATFYHGPAIGDLDTSF